MKLERRLPDVLILGVKKCGTMTLGRSYIWNLFFFLPVLYSNILTDNFLIQGTILGMHPNIVVPKGNVEIPFFSFTRLYQRGVEYYKVGWGQTIVNTQLNAIHLKVEKFNKHSLLILFLYSSAKNA